MNPREPASPFLTASAVMTLVFLLCVTLAGVIALAFIDPSPLHTAPTLAQPTTPVLTPLQQKAQRRLTEANQKAQAALTTRLKTLADLFSRGKGGAKDFADEALSWSGKWALLKGKIGLGEDKAHEKFLAESFSKHVFGRDDVKSAVDTAIKGFLIDLDEIESVMLVQLRADLADGPESSLPEYLRSDEAFRKEYQRFQADAARTLNRDMNVTIGREVGMFVASDIAAQVGVRVARFVAAELGLEAGILGAGATSSVATFGIGLIAAVILDYVLDVVFKMAGYNPAGEIESKVKASVGNVESVLIDGNGGLRHELENINKVRADLREGIVNKLVAERSK